MPPACPVEVYVRHYYGDSPQLPFAGFACNGVAVAGKTGKGKERMGDWLCSEERDAPPGKPVASQLSRALPLSSKRATSKRACEGRAANCPRLDYFELRILEKVDMLVPGHVAATLAAERQ